MTRTSYWLEEELIAFPERRDPRRADVVIVGGGVTGCSCALTLAEHGVQVRLYEAREIAGGASGRNGGFALRGAATPYDVTRADLGGDAARSLMTLTERALDRLERLAGDAFERLGSLRLAVDEAELADLRAEHEALEADEFAVDWLDDLPAPLDRLYLGALLHPTDGALQPARWVRRLARQAADAGAELRLGERLDLGALPSDVGDAAVVVATDGFTAAALPELATTIQPTRGQVLVTEPLADVRYARPHYARGGYDYWHQRPDGRLVIGGSRDAAFADEQTDTEGTTDAVQTRIQALAADLMGVTPVVERRWSGIWGTTPDGLPLVGQLPGRDRTWIAAGYSGHGNVLGLACGELVARSILGEAPDELAFFDPARASLRRTP